MELNDVGTDEPRVAQNHRYNREIDVADVDRRGPSTRRPQKCTRHEPSLRAPTANEAGPAEAGEIYLLGAAIVPTDHDQLEIVIAAELSPHSRDELVDALDTAELTNPTDKKHQSATRRHRYDELGVGLGVAVGNGAGSGSTIDPVSGARSKQTLRHLRDVKAVCACHP